MLQQSQILVLRRWWHPHQVYALTIRCLYSSSSSSSRDKENDNNHIDSKNRILSEDRPRKGQPHPRNSFQGTYDMDNLIAHNYNLKQYVTIEPNTGRQTINWANPSAVRALNTAILITDYGCHPTFASILPHDALVPPVPGRADYVHYIADLLQKSTARDNNDDINIKVVPRGEDITGFDIGTGASCIYPTIAASIYGWRMIATDINHIAINSARKIVKANDHTNLIDVRHQEYNNASIFDGSVLKPNERIDFCMCNPPFYASKEAFQAENQRKMKGLAKGKKKVMPSDDETTTLSSNKAISTTKRITSNNFGGLESELWCTDGEVGFVKRIYMESKRYWNQCLWFTSLVSRKENVRKIERYIQKDRKKKKLGDNKNRCVEMIQKQPMGAGRKSCTILMWTFLDEKERQDWFKGRRI